MKIYKTKPCKRCGNLFTPTSPCNTYCSTDCRGKNAYYIRNYGITQDDLEAMRSEEHTSELQSLMRISYAVFCLKKKKKTNLRTSYNKSIHLNHNKDSHKCNNRIIQHVERRYNHIPSCK